MQHITPIKRPKRKLIAALPASRRSCVLAFGVGFFLVLAAGNTRAGSDWLYAHPEAWEWLPFAPRSASPEGAIDQATLQGLVTSAGLKYKVPPELLWAMISVESQFEHRARSSANALGLMQLQVRTARELGVRNPFDPTQNIDAGARYISRLLKRYRGKTELALAAYNAGPESVRRHKGVPPFPETRTYVRRVMERYRERQSRPT